MPRSEAAHCPDPPLAPSFFFVPFLMYNLFHLLMSMSMFDAIHCPVPCRSDLGLLELEGGEVRIEVCVHEELEAVYAHLIDVAMLWKALLVLS